VRDIDTFLEFLAQIEALAGLPERRPQLTVGDHFRP
jgi:hypothetical protein